MIHRRTFLKQSGLALAATTLLPQALLACGKERTLGLQLYSLREIIGQDVKGVIKKVADIGFKEVETYGYSSERGFWGLGVGEFKNLLRENGMSSPSGHYGADDFLAKGGTENDFQYALDAANELGQKYVIIPYIAESQRTSIDDYKRIAEKFNRVGELCKKAGLKFAYHNHAFEFQDFNGKTGFDVLLNQTDEDLVAFELDIYWVVRAGIEPGSLFRRHPGRFELWHIKDMDRQEPDLNTEVGSGSVDYQEIFKHSKKSGVEHFIVEQENFELDPFQSLRQSFNYIQKKV